MRLYLSSFRIGNCPERLIDLVKGNRQAIVVANACDHYPDRERRAGIDRELEALSEMGFTAHELDLRLYFGEQQNNEELRSVLHGCGLVWVRGGNTFVLRRAMRLSGFDSLLKVLIDDDALVYGGYSAGASVLTPSLHGVESVDDPKIVPANYDENIVWEGLGILPYFVVPHYRSNHPESESVERYVQYCLDHSLLFRTLKDGEVIVVNGANEEFYSVTAKSASTN